MWHVKFIAALLHSDRCHSGDRAQKGVSICRLFSSVNRETGVGSWNRTAPQAPCTSHHHYLGPLSASQPHLAVSAEKQDHKEDGRRTQVLGIGLRDEQLNPAAGKVTRCPRVIVQAARSESLVRLIRTHANFIFKFTHQ